MAGKVTREDLQNSEVISGLVAKANLQVFGSVREQARALMELREACSQRGYHLVESEPADDDELMICYDCELWFDREFAESCGMKYKVESAR